jgi:CheY-like chemotaxis protein
MRVLVIEDNDDKWERLSAITLEVLPRGATIVRAVDLYEAQQRLEEEGWDLLLLDMTLDLRRGGARRPGTAQDYTGGLKIIGQMYYDELMVPTAIITGFDSFPTSRTNGDGVVLGLEAVEREARRQLGDMLIGTVRHGPPDWEAKLRALVGDFVRRRG